MLVYYPLSFFFLILQALWYWSQCPYRFQNEPLYSCSWNCKAVTNENEFFTLYLQCWVSGSNCQSNSCFLKLWNCSSQASSVSSGWAGSSAFFFSLKRLKLWREFLSIYDSCFFYSRITGRHFVLNKYIFSEVYKRSDMCCCQFQPVVILVKSAAVLIEILYFWSWC